MKRPCQRSIGINIFILLQSKWRCPDWWHTDHRTSTQQKTVLKCLDLIFVVFSCDHMLVSINPVNGTHAVTKDIHIVLCFECGLTHPLWALPPLSYHPTLRQTTALKENARPWATSQDIPRRKVKAIYFCFDPKTTIRPKTR